MVANPHARRLDGFAALADPTRRRVFERVARGPGSVAKVAAGLPVTRPAVSQHLKVLKAAGLVTAERRGACQIYRVDPRGIGRMRDYLDRFWDRALEAFKEAAERAEESQS